jgi:hypothetical protein
LSEAKILRVENTPGDPEAGQTEPGELIDEKMVVLRKPHAVYVFRDECQRTHLPKCPVKFGVKEIDAIGMVSSSTLAVSLAWIASSKDIRAGKPSDSSHIAWLNRVHSAQPLIKLACNRVDFIGPSRFD